MLVLSRKLGEKIYIGADVVITVVDIDRGKIRLGIEAPKEVPIYRQELLPIKELTLKHQRQTLEEYDRTHDNGCSICRDPDCTNPGGKH